MCFCAKVRREADAMARFGMNKAEKKTGPQGADYRTANIRGMNIGVLKIEIVHGMSIS